MLARRPVTAMREGQYPPATAFAVTEECRARLADGPAVLEAMSAALLA